MSSCAQDSSDVGLQGVVLPAYIGKEQAGLVRWVVIKGLCCVFLELCCGNHCTLASATASLTADIRHVGSSEQYKVVDMAR